MSRMRVVAALIIAVAVAALIVWRVRSRGEPDRAAPTSASVPAPAPASSAPVSEVARRVVPGRRVIFIGLDGGDWALLDQYMARGSMPALKRLVDEGVRGSVTTIHPPLSPLVWTTMLTGVSPLEHRVLDFLRVHPVSHAREPITSDERKAPAIWNMATAGGKRVGSFGFWATYPAEAVNGVMVSDRLFTFLYSESVPPPGVVSPANMEGWAHDALKRAEHEVDLAEMKRFLPWLDEAAYHEALAVTNPYDHPVSALRRILIETRVYESLSRDWIAREQPDLALVYIQGTDSIGHVFAPYTPPRQASIPEAAFEHYKDVPQRYFEHVDRMLDAYRQLADSTGAVLMLASDHGFAWTEGRPTQLSSVANATAARWHRDEGMYLVWGRDIPASHDAANRGSVQQVCATLLALIGLPPGKDIAGPALPGVKTTGADAVDYRAYYSPQSPAGSAEPASAQKGDAESIEKLRALGYIGASEGSGRVVGTRTAGSLNNEGLLLKQQGKTKEAMDAFDNALTVDPNLASAAWNLSDLLFSLNQSLDKSDALLVRAFAHGLPESTKYLIGRAIGYQRNGQIQRSVALLNQALAARPDEPELWLFRGRYRVETGDCPGAVTDFQRATQLAATNPAAFASQGVAQMCAGDAVGARASFQRSLQLDPNQPKLRAYLRGGTR